MYYYTGPTHCPFSSQGLGTQSGFFAGPADKVHRRATKTEAWELRCREHPPINVKLKTILGGERELNGKADNLKDDVNNKQELELLKSFVVLM